MSSTLHDIGVSRAAKLSSRWTSSPSGIKVLENRWKSGFRLDLRLLCAGTDPVAAGFTRLDV